MESTNKNLSANSGNGNHANKKLLYSTILAIVVVVIVIAALLLSINKPANNLTSSTAPTTIAKTQNSTTISNSTQNNLSLQSKSFNFLNTFNPTKGLSTYATYNLSSVPSDKCSGNSIVAFYTPNGINTVSAVVDFPNLNKSIPYAEYVKLSFINQSNLQYYSNSFNLNSGLCNASSSFFNIMSTNASAGRSTMYLQNGLKAYMMEFSNFNANAMNYTDTLYVGPKPNVSWYVLNVLYKNVSIQVSDYGITGHMNVSHMLNVANNVTSFLNRTPNS
jgi:hypothetical protein